MLNIYLVTDWFDDAFDSYPAESTVVFAHSPERALELSGFGNARAEQIGWKTGEQVEGQVEGVCQKTLVR